MRNGKLLLLALVATSCAGLTANQRSPGAFSNGNFAPSRATAVNYGPDATRSCLRSSAITLVDDGVQNSAKASGKPAPTTEGRLCAVAETFLSWSDESPPADVIGFVASYFGLPSQSLRISVATITTPSSQGEGSEKDKDVAQRLIEPITSFAASNPNPRYAVATQYLNKNQTKVVLVQQDQSLDLQPVPRKLAPGGSAPLAGKVNGDFENLKVLVSDPQGNLDSPKISSDKSFQTELKCGDKPGQFRIEVRGERNGAVSDLANFAVACGGELPVSIAAAAPSGAKSGEASAGAAKETPAAAAPESPEVQEKKVLELINAERTAAGLQPLEPDASVAAVARAISEKKGDISTADLNAALKQNEVASPVILVNPAQSTSGPAAQKAFETRPANRANYMSKDATHAGISVVMSKDAAGKQTAFLTEIFVKELPTVDGSQLKAKLRERIVQKRKDGRAAPLKNDATLDEVAQKYADELVKAKGAMTAERDREILRPLYKSFRSVDYIEGVKADPLDFAEEPAIMRNDKLVGVGVGQGTSVNFGRNSVFVVIIVGTKK